MAADRPPTTTYAQHLIDDSTAVTIRLDSIRRPDRRPDEEYWNSFEEGKRLYSLEKYKEAKNIFVSLIAHNKHQDSLFEQLVKTYRAIIRRKRHRSLVQTYKEFAEYFRVCERYITKYDVSNLNKLIAAIGRKYTIVKDQPIEIPEIREKPRVPDMQINTSGNVKLLEEIPRLHDKLVLGALKRRRLKRHRRPLHKSVLSRPWSIGLSSHGTVLASSHFNRAFVILRDSTGAIVGERLLKHGLHRFATARYSDKFAGISDGYLLYLYSLERGCISTCDIRNTITDVPDGWSLDIEGYSIRNVCLSPDGEFVLITICGGAWLLGADLEPIASWIPHPRKGIGRDQRGVDFRGSRRKQAIRILGLTENFTEEDIKQAFRSKIMQVHPDLHPEDESANERTRDVVDAYNILAHSSCESERNTGITITLEPLLDWVYAAWLEPRAKSLYLGYYSGLVRHINKDGVVEEIFDCDDTVYSVRKIDGMLQVETLNGIYIIQGSTCVSTIPFPHHFETLEWAEFGFILNSGKEVVVFSNFGKEIARIIFKSKVYTAYGVGQKLEAMTHYKRYIFDVS